jgi:hypothetical protein
MKALAVAVAVLVAVMASYAVGASAGRADLAADAQREPVWVPNPTQYSILSCGEQRSLALITHWPSPFHTEYVARFRAHGQAGSISFIRQQPQWQVETMVLPPPDPEQYLSLSLPVVQRADPLSPAPQLIQVSVQMDECGRGADKPLTLDISDLNIFVR